MKNYDERAVNIPKIRLEEHQIAFIEEHSKKKNVKQSKVFQKILRSHYEAKVAKLLNASSGTNRD